MASEIDPTTLTDVALNAFLSKIDESASVDDIPGLRDRIEAGPTRWEMLIDGGDGGCEYVLGSLERAIERVKRLARCGDYDLSDGGVSVHLSVRLAALPDGHEWHDEIGWDDDIDILPEEPECLVATEHDWSSVHEGGCTENPGVWSTGGTSMLFRSHCLCCGMSRVRRSTGSRRDPGESDTVKYGEPDAGWLAEHVGEEKAEALREVLAERERKRE